jgi:IS1 family transposase
MVNMNQLTNERRAEVIRHLVEGNSIRSIVRLTGVAKNTIVKLLFEVGAACCKHHDTAIRNLNCQRIQCDEIWSFCYAKQKNVPRTKAGQFGYGDVWTWTALCADTKLIVTYNVGPRMVETAHDFVVDLAGRLNNRIQLTTDGNRLYVNAVERAFGADVDYAMLIKMYGNDHESETRYSPAECIGCRTAYISGDPNPRHISTSFVERQNLSMRMSMRRFSRLTNAFSKKIENHVAAVALYFTYYNFCRVHQTLRVTPAMEAGLTDHVWGVEEIVGLLNKK